MGEYRNAQNIRCFTPDSTDDLLYVDADHAVDLEEILDRACQHFKRDVSVADIKIQAEHIQVECLGYDQYDPTDHKNFLSISLVDDT